MSVSPYYFPITKLRQLIFLVFECIEKHKLEENNQLLWDFSTNLRTLAQSSIHPNFRNVLLENVDIKKLYYEMNEIIEIINKHLAFKQPQLKIKTKLRKHFDVLIETRNAIEAFLRGINELIPKEEKTLFFELNYFGLNEEFENIDNLLTTLPARNETIAPIDCVIDTEEETLPSQPKIYDKASITVTANLARRGFFKQAQILVDRYGANPIYFELGKLHYYHDNEANLSSIPDVFKTITELLNKDSRNIPIFLIYIIRFNMYYSMIHEMKNIFQTNKDILKPTLAFYIRAAIEIGNYTFAEDLLEIFDISFPILEETQQKFMDEDEDDEQSVLTSEAEYLINIITELEEFSFLEEVAISDQFSSSEKEDILLTTFAEEYVTDDFKQFLKKRIEQSSENTKTKEALTSAINNFSSLNTDKKCNDIYSLIKTEYTRMVSESEKPQHLFHPTLRLFKKRKFEKVKEENYKPDDKKRKISYLLNQSDVND